MRTIFTQRAGAMLVVQLMPPDSEPTKPIRINLPPVWVWWVTLGACLLTYGLVRVFGPVLEVARMTSPLPRGWTPAAKLLEVDWMDSPEAKGNFEMSLDFAAAEDAIYFTETQYLQRGYGSTNPNRIVSMDAAGTVHRSAILSGDARELVFWQDSLWMLNVSTSPSIWRFDPATLQRTAVIELPEHLQQLDEYLQAPQWTMDWKLVAGKLYLAAVDRDGKVAHPRLQRMEVWRIEPLQDLLIMASSLEFEPQEPGDNWVLENLVWRVEDGQSAHFFDALTGQSLDGSSEYALDRSIDMESAYQQTRESIDAMDWFCSPWQDRIQQPPIALASVNTSDAPMIEEDPGWGTVSDRWEYALRDLYVEKNSDPQLDSKLALRSRQAQPMMVADLDRDGPIARTLLGDQQSVQQFQLQQGTWDPGTLMQVSRLDDRNCLVSQVIIPTPADINAGHGVIRFGKLAVGASEIDWLVALALPPPPPNSATASTHLWLWKADAHWTIRCSIRHREITGGDVFQNSVCFFDPPPELASDTVGWHQ